MRNFFLTRYRKHKKHLANLMMAATAAVGVSAGSAYATSIPILNAGFEDHPPGYTGTMSGGAEGWVGTGWYVGFKHSQDYGGYLNAPSSMTQVLGTNWAAGTYTLNGFASYATNPNGLTLTLQNGATVVGSPLNPTLTTSLGTLSALPPLIVTVGVGDVGTIGNPISIKLANSGPGQVFFDDFTLDFQPVPEPGSLSLIGIGSIGLGLLARRNRKNLRAFRSA
jgi:hypothetical protein